jgi:glycosyltransferase involved in cell wall biosynthesis
MTERPLLSACIIARDEERDIGDCLESVSFCDERIVVDAGSRDRTVEIARAAGARVIVRGWPGHIAQKNFALEQATGEWVLAVDADERVTPELRAEIERELARPAVPFDGFSVPRRSFYMGRWIRHSGWYPDRKVRLVRRGRARWGGVDPHDRLECAGPVKRLRGDLLHYSYRDLAEHLRKIDAFTSIAAREKEARGARAFPDIVLRPPAKFLKSYVWKLGLLDGLPGFVIAALGAYYVFLKYAKLIERRRGWGVSLRPPAG